MFRKFIHTIFISTLILFFTMLPFKAKSQGNLPFSDDKLLHFGFSLGLNFVDFNITPTNKDYNANVSDVVPGFSVGAISDLRLNRYLNLRFTPTLMFNQRILNFQDSTKADLLSVPLYLPFYLKYSSERTGNFRPYLIAGSGLWIDWGRNKEKSILLKPFDVLFEIGAGCNLYFAFFKLAPELKFAFGLNNMLTPLNERDAGSLLNPETIRHTEAIQKLGTRMITLTFNFE